MGEIKEGDDVVICSVCEMPHHRECWDANGGCTTFGCNGVKTETATHSHTIGQRKANASNNTICSKCGYSFSADHNFCPKCGATKNRSNKTSSTSAMTQSNEIELSFEEVPNTHLTSTIPNSTYQSPYGNTNQGIVYRQQEAQYQSELERIAPSVGGYTAAHAQLTGIPIEGMQYSSAAVAGFVLSFFAGGGILAIIFCAIGMFNTHHHPLRGRGLAIAGWYIIAGWWLLLIIMANTG
jgi:hypothetical protein